MGLLGSKAAIDAASKQSKLTEEDKQWLKDNFESSTCASNGNYCLKGCKYLKGSECQRMINRKKTNNND